jgi:hypothetical protein
MCFGGGVSLKRQEVPYEKPDYGPLPSLSMDEVRDRRGPEFRSVEVRGGTSARSLLMPVVGGN